MPERQPSRRAVLVSGLAAAAGACLPAAARSTAALAPRDDAPHDFIAEGKRERDRRMEWWRDARFGMFIHWGLYAVPAGIWKGKRLNGIGEWIMAAANIPREEYAELAKRFNPVDFNAADWVRTAKGAGMRYIVITSKHHDGFAMFGSKVSPYNIVDATPFRRDPLKELSEECKRQGVKFCVYHSILDWHHPAQTPRPDAKDFFDARANDGMLPGRKDEYVTYLRGQLRELIKGYDPAVLWFDGEWPAWWTEADGKALYNYCRGLKRDLIINNRVGKARGGGSDINLDKSFVGDFGTPEQQIPPTGLPGVDWESCMTMNDTWGYKSFDHNWKSAKVLIQNLCDIASKGGNFLLNVGPTPEGMIPTPSVERLRAVGEWTRVNGEAIYGTEASPFAKQLPWGRATRRGKRLYLMVFDWPANRTLSLEGLKSGVKKATLLADGAARLRVTRSGERVTLDLPATAPDANVSVIALELHREPQ